MAAVKFDGVDVLDFLGKVVELHTQHYKDDFDIDKELIQNLAACRNEENEQLLWMSRTCGTYCLWERDVYLQDSHENKVWRFYHEQTKDSILAYAIQLDGIQDGKVTGCIWPLDYHAHVERVKLLSCAIEKVSVLFQDGTQAVFPYTRCDTLKGDYTEQAIKERIAGTRTVKPRRTSPPKPVSKVGLLVDIEAAVRSGKGPGYERWAKVFNLKQLSQAVIWLKEHGDMSYEDLQKRSDAATDSFNALSAQIKELESQMTANGELQKQIVNYAKTRAVYVEYRKAGYSKKFRAAHETEILLHQAAKKHFDELGITKLPSVKSLREEYTGLLEQKRKAYSSYKQARADMKELYNIRANVEHLLDIPTGREPQKESQKSRQ